MLESSPTRKNVPAEALPLALFVVNDPSFFLSHRKNIAEAARSLGLKVALASPPGPGVEEVLSAGFEYHPISLSRWSGNPVTELKAIQGLISLYKRLKPTLVHHVTIKPVLYGSIAARKADVPCVVNAISGLGQVFSAQGLWADIRFQIVLMLYRRAFAHKHMRTLFQNPDDRNLFIEKSLIDSEKTVLIPGAGVNLERFSPRPDSPGVPVVMLASRLLKEKGIGEFVEAARTIRASGIEASFIVVGDAPQGNPGMVSEVQIEEWKKEGVVEFWGFQRDMAQAFSKAHIVCLPSYYKEGIPKALIEAAACGKAIVTTDWPGCREVVRRGESGLLVPPRSVPALVEALKTLILDGNLRKMMGSKGRQLVEQGGFGEREVVSKTMEVYQELLREVGVK